MKKLLLLTPLLLLAFNSKYTSHLNSYMQNLKCDEVLHKKAFDICYSCNKKEPNAVAYILTRQMETGKHYSRKKLHFRPDYELPRKCRAYPSDYVHSGYDRGHNAPNAAFNYNRSIQKQTFLMSNIAPQAKWLNRIYLGKKVENLARFFAIKYNKIEVITGVCGSKGYLKHNVNIPKWWYKIIYIPLIHKTLAFLTPNSNAGMKTAKIKEYKATIEKIKQVCGF